MSKLICYMEGTDPLWLTILQAQGHCSMPLSNGLDGHGLNIRLLTKHTRPDLIICYLHKLIAPKGEDVPPEELLLPARLYDVPVLVVCPTDLHEQARQLLADASADVELVDPEDVLDLANQHLQ